MSGGGRTHRRGGATAATTAACRALQPPQTAAGGRLQVLGASATAVPVQTAALGRRRRRAHPADPPPPPPTTRPAHAATAPVRWRRRRGGVAGPPLPSATPQAGGPAAGLLRLARPRGTRPRQWRGPPSHAWCGVCPCACPLTAAAGKSARACRRALAGVVGGAVAVRCGRRRVMGGRRLPRGSRALASPRRGRRRPRRPPRSRAGGRHGLPAPRRRMCRSRCAGRGKRLHAAAAYRPSRHVTLPHRATHTLPHTPRTHAPIHTHAPPTPDSAAARSGWVQARWAAARHRPSAAPASRWAKRGARPAVGQPRPVPYAQRPPQRRERDPNKQKKKKPPAPAGREQIPHPLYIRLPPPPLRGGCRGGHAATGSRPLPSGPRCDGKQQRQGHGGGQGSGTPFARHSQIHRPPTPPIQRVPQHCLVTPAGQ